MRYDTTPLCPVCHDYMIHVERRRITWDAWAHVWHCRCCATDYTIPEQPEGEELHDDSKPANR